MGWECQFDDVGNCSVLCQEGNHHHRGSSRKTYSSCPVNNTSSVCNACNNYCQFGNQCGSPCNTCNDCQRCNTSNSGCNSCLTCIKCNRCQSCQNGNQPLYDDETVSQACGNVFKWDVDPMSTSSVMGPKTGHFNKDVWNKIITYYNNNRPSGTSSLTKYNPSSGTPFTATEFKRVANAVGYSYSTSNIASGKIIKGSYFRDLANAVNNMVGGSCVAYNTCSTCNGSCNNCLNCNSCQNCNDNCQVCERIDTRDKTTDLENFGNYCIICDVSCEHCNTVIIDRCGYYCNKTAVTTIHGKP